MADSIAKRNVRRRWAVSLFAVVLLLLFGYYANHGLRRPAFLIRNSLLRDTPLGSSYDDVFRHVARKYKLDRYYDEYGVERYGPPGGTFRMVDSDSIEVHLGHYRTIFRTDVTAEWMFRDGRKLTDVSVKKDIDAP